MPIPPISVAIATYNGAPYLAEQLNSILSQTLKPSEIIITDDCSTDGTIDILKDFQERGLITYYINKERLGYIANFKRAVSLCTPDNYIALSDQDDVWLPRKLEAAMNTMQELAIHDEPAMIYSDLILVDPDLNVLNPSFRNELGQDGYKHCLETVLFGGFVNGCTMLMNPAMVSYFETIPPNSEVPHDSWISLIAQTFGKVGQIPEALILYRKHSDNATEVGGFQKKSRLKRWRDELIHAFKENDLFEMEISVAELFYQEFKHKLSPYQHEVFKEFLALKGKGYLWKKIALRKAFRGRWG